MIGLRLRIARIMTAMQPPRKLTPESVSKCQAVSEETAYYCTTADRFVTSLARILSLERRTPRRGRRNVSNTLECATFLSPPTEVLATSRDTLMTGQSFVILGRLARQIWQM